MLGAGGWRASTAEPRINAGLNGKNLLVTAIERTAVSSLPRVLHCPLLPAMCEPDGTDASPDAHTALAADKRALTEAQRPKGKTGQMDVAGTAMARAIGPEDVEREMMFLMIQALRASPCQVRSVLLSTPTCTCHATPANALCVVGCCARIWSHTAPSLPLHVY